MKENKTIKMEINKKELIKMLSAYYSEKLGQEIEIKYNLKSELRGYGMGQDEVTFTEFYFVNKIRIGNVETTVTTTLDNIEVKEALNEILGKLNYGINSLIFDVVQELRGYGMCDAPYFKGVILELKEKGFEKKLK